MRVISLTFAVRWKCSRFTKQTMQAAAHQERCDCAVVILIDGIRVPYGKSTPPIGGVKVRVKTSRLGACQPWWRCRWDADGHGCGAACCCPLVAGPSVLYLQTKAWRVDSPHRIVVEMVFFVLGAAQCVFVVQTGELMRWVTLLRCGSWRLSCFLVLPWGGC